MEDSMAIDPRLNWMKRKILTFMNVKNENLYQSMLERNNKRALHLMKSFVKKKARGVQDYERLILFVFKTSYDPTLVHREEMLIEECYGTQEVSQDQPTDQDSEKEDIKSKKVTDKENTTTPLSPSKLVKGKPKKSAVKSKSPKKPKSPSTAVETLTKETKPPKIIKKPIEKRSPLPELHAHFGTLQELPLGKQSYVVFMRTNQKNIPEMFSEDQADAEMPYFFQIASFNTDWQLCLIKTLKMAIPFIKSQFREPTMYTTYFVKDFPDPPGMDYNDHGVTSYYLKAIEIHQNLEREDGKYTCDKLAALSVNPMYTTLEEVLQGNLKRKSEKKRIDFEKIRSQYSVKECKEITKLTHPKFEPLKDKLLLDIRKMVQFLLRSFEREKDMTELFKAPAYLLDYIEDCSFDESSERNEDLIKNFDLLARQCYKQMGNILEIVADTKVMGSSPLLELQYWNKRALILEPIVKELNNKYIKKIILVLDLNGWPLSENFKKRKLELENFYSLCSKSASYLKSCRAEFKALEKAEDLKTIRNIMPSLMEAIYNAWCLLPQEASQYPLEGLMVRIKWVFTEQVKKTLNLEKLFDLPLGDVQDIALAVMATMELWKNLYLAIEERILEYRERYKIQAKWNIVNKKEFFKPTDHLTFMASKLHKMASVLAGFLSVFCLEFSEIVIPSSAIDDIINRLYALIRPIINTKYDVFNIKHAEIWTDLVYEFEQNIPKLEKEALKVINLAFKNLRSSVKATKILLRFKTEKILESLRDLLMTKFDDVILQYIKELASITKIFKEEKSNPPIMVRHPPKAGQIFWARILLERAKIPLLYLKCIPEITERRKLWSKAIRDYSYLARKLAAFEEAKFKEWLLEIGSQCDEFLRQKIIKLVHKPKQLKVDSEQSLQGSSSTESESEVEELESAMPTKSKTDSPKLILAHQHSLGAESTFKPDSKKLNMRMTESPSENELSEFSSESLGGMESPDKLSSIAPTFSSITENSTSTESLSESESKSLTRIATRIAALTAQDILQASLPPKQLITAGKRPKISPKQMFRRTFTEYVKQHPKLFSLAQSIQQEPHSLYQYCASFRPRSRIIYSCIYREQQKPKSSHWKRSLFQESEDPGLDSSSTVCDKRKPKGNVQEEKTVHELLLGDEEYVTQDADLKLVTEAVSLSEDKLNLEDSKSMPWNQFINDKTLLELSLSFDVNYIPAMFNMIEEAEMMLSLGFEIPKNVYTITLMKKSFCKHLFRLTDMIEKYQRLMFTMGKPEQLILKESIQNAEQILQLGMSVYSWESMGGIDYYCTKACSCLDHLSFLLNEVQFVKSQIEMKLDSLKKINFFSEKIESPENTDLPSCKNFFKKINEFGDMTINNVLGIYQGIAQKIIELEAVVLDETTGCSKNFTLFCKVYELQLKESFTDLLSWNLASLKNILEGNIGCIFEIKVILKKSIVAPELDGDSFCSLVAMSMDSLMNRFSNVRKWWTGTCIEITNSNFFEEIIPDANGPVEFYSELCNVEEILMQMFEIEYFCEYLAQDYEEYINTLNCYVYLWTFDKKIWVDEFLETDPSIADFDNTLGHFSNIITNFRKKKNFLDKHCIRIRLDYINNLILNETLLWKLEVGSRLVKMAQELINEIQDTSKILSDSLAVKVANLDQFKCVMQAIRDVNDLAVEMDMKFCQIKKFYSLLARWSIVVPKEDKMLKKKLYHGWKVMIRRAFYCRLVMQPIKAIFASETRRRIKKFAHHSKLFALKFFSKGPISVGMDLDLGFDMMKLYGPQFEAWDYKRDEVAQAEKLFCLPATDFGDYDAASKCFQDLKSLYKFYNKLKRIEKKWAKKLWVKLNPQDLIDGIDSIFEDFYKFPEMIRLNLIGQAIETYIEGFKNTVPFVVNLKSEALRDRHWQELMIKIDKSFDIKSNNFTLGDMFSLEFHLYQEQCEEIFTNAKNELSIEKGITTLDSIWTNMNFTIEKYFKGNKDQEYNILGSIDDILLAIDESSMNLQNMSISQFIGPFINSVQKWENTISLTSEIVTEWMILQKKWMHLEAVFIGGGDISLKMSDEAKKFSEIDKAFHQIMADAVNRPLILDQCLMPGRLQGIINLSTELDKCQKSLNNYLESKRNTFPRFFFLSDGELLSILGNMDPKGVQDHIIKMFDNIDSLHITEDGNECVVTGMISHEKEIMYLNQLIRTSDQVELWMSDVIQEMKRSNRDITKKAIQDYVIDRKERTEWLLGLLGMVGLAAIQLWWTVEVEQVFKKIKEGNDQAMEKYEQQLSSQIDSLVKKVQGILTRNDRKKLNTVLIVDVHARDTVHEFVAWSIADAHAFEWESKLRFYWSNIYDDLMVVQCSGQFRYGYEYMGLNGRLVITPLTDRIYLTMTQALSMKLGGAPTGPAGTGKTETIKDLAKAMGLLCMVTNCGEGLDFMVFGKILNGLCQCGAWGCFDEFNRIDISVLSVISTQLKSIRDALFANVESVMIEGNEIYLDKNIGIFVTMNPGYAGRTELPESVKAQFRPVVCTVPDMKQICFIMLFSEGFVNAKILATRMNALYKFAHEQMSRQHHYDFGLRAMKSVLLMAGELRRSSPDIDESTVLMKSLRDMNLPKLVYEDVPIFLALIEDLFPGLDSPKVAHFDFSTAVENVIRTTGYIVIPNQVDIVVQLYETMSIRHSTMILGPTGGGKSVAIQTLARTQTSLGLPTELYILNPKACTVIELYGILDPLTKDWTDGLLSRIFREANKSVEKPERKYIVFDGDVDALWIENMNSVMDDNKMLTLPNGERIRLLSHCALLFEVGNLQYASPATVSRAGMIYVNPRHLGYTPYWKRWLLSRKNTNQSKLLDKMFNQFVPPTINLIFEGLPGLKQVSSLTTIVPQTPLNMVTQLCFLLEAMLPENEEENKKHIKTDSSGITVEELECIFLLAIYNSLGACLNSDSRIHFDAFVKSISGLLHIEESKEKRATFRFLPQKMPTLFDYCIDRKGGFWVTWQDMVEPYTHDTKERFCDIFVPTVESTKTKWILNLMNQVQRPAALVGETGTSKTTTVTKFVSDLSLDRYVLVNLNFSSRTTSLDVQRNLETYVKQYTKNSYGPPIGKKIIVFIDDLNMPQVDAYGTQQPIALLKLFLENGGMYDRRNYLNWKKFTGICFYAAMGCVGGGRNEVDPRFISLFSVYNMTFPSDTTITHIYLSILEGHTDKFTDEIKSTVPKIIKATLNLFKIAIMDLPPTPSKFHYIFNLRDLSRIMSGILLTTPKHYSQPEQFVRVWRNEFTRIICDRLINFADQELMKKHISNIISNNFKNYFEHVMRDPMVFGDFRNALYEHIQRDYEDLSNYETVSQIFIEILDSYNKNNFKLNLVMFEDALEHLIRIHRVLRIHKGHGMIIGVDGCGKNSLTKLAAFTAGCQIFSIKLSSEYNEASFKEDLKRLHYFVGVERKPTVFFFSAAQIAEEGFLEFIGNLLATGMIPTIFTEEDKLSILNQIHGTALKDEFDATKSRCWDFFSKSCKDNLHIILSMSPVGDILRTRCRNFPALVNNTSIDWIFPWPEQALFEVARNFLESTNGIPCEHLNSIITHVIHVHKSLDAYTENVFKKSRRKNYVLPKHYIDFINLYGKLLEEKNNEISAQRLRLKSGLGKIAEATTQLDELKAKLGEQNVIIAEKSEACEDLMTQIADASKFAMQKKEIASSKCKEIEQKKKKIAMKEKYLDNAFSQVSATFDKARTALNVLREKDITEIRSFVTPPEPVEAVCECVCILKGMDEVNWKSAKDLMTDPNFLMKLREMNINMITVEQQLAITERLKASTEIGEMERISKTGYLLLKFLKAVLGYCKVYTKLKPNMEEETNLRIAAREARKDLDKLNLEIQDIEDTLRMLNVQYLSALMEKQGLQEETEVIIHRLTAADKLFTGFDSERIRWTELLDGLQTEQKLLVGNCLLSAAFLNYTGPFSFEFRVEMVYSDWYESILKLEIPITKFFRLERQFITDGEISRLHSEGLPQDELSIQNGILTTKSARFPLCIDPQGQALKWIQTRESKFKLNISRFSNSNFLNDLEMSIKHGIPIIVQDVDYIDPVVDNVLEKNIIVRDGRVFVELGVKEVDYNPSFRLYLMTKLPNPSLKPTVYAKVTVVNYAVTMTGLEDQLLSVVVKSEHPDLQLQWENLINETNENINCLKTLEDSFLIELTLYSGNMLDSTELVETLEKNKSKAEEVQKKLELSSCAATDLKIVRNGYRPCAKRGAVLFFLLLDMAVVNPMYQYSFNSYLELFRISVERAELGQPLRERVVNIINLLTKNVYEYGCTGILERHKLLFSIQMTIKIQESEGKVTASELEFFLKGNMSIEKYVSMGLPDWIPEQGKKDLLKLAADFPDEFGSLVNNIIDDPEIWKAWYDLDEPDSVPLPSDYSTNVTPFRKLMLIRCLRIDRVYQCATNYVSEIMGEDYITPIFVSLKKISELSTPAIPIILISSPGLDPTNEVIKLAEMEGKLTTFRYLSLGRGKEKVALELLSRCFYEGYWLILQNCHLLVSFIRLLDQKLESMRDPHHNFRLWLTTDPIGTFPIGLLQNSLKVVTEPPSGLKLHLRNTYLKMNPEFLNQCGHPVYKPLIFILTFFHGVVQERKKYGKLGWNICYDFNENDFMASTQIIETYLTKTMELKCNKEYELSEELNPVPWKTLKYLIGEVIYGGRVIDTFDQRIMNVLLNDYMNDETLNKDFTFYSDCNYTYHTPSEGSREHYIESIEQLPLMTVPGALGLHLNAELSYSTWAAKDIWNHLINIQLQADTIEDGVNREDFVDALAKNILKKLPSIYEVSNLRETYELSLTPTKIFLLQELERFNLLIIKMETTLTQLRRVIAGEMGMDEVTENTANMLYLGQLPATWRNLTPETCKSLGDWIAYFISREEQYKYWSEEGEPLVVWLSGLHIPQAYLTAIVQMASRRNEWPLAKSTFYTVVTEYREDSEVYEKSEMGSYISGLFIEAARWNFERKCLVEPLPKIPTEPFPILCIVPTTREDTSKETLRTPVYTTSKRRNAMGVGLVFEADLAMEVKSNHWILKGVCLTLNKD